MNPTANLKLPDFFHPEFGKNIAHAVQQKVSRTRAFCSMHSINGKSKSFNFMDEGEMKPITTRSGKTSPDETLMEKRWAYKSPFEKVSWFDEWDDELLGEIALPTSQEMQRHKMAAGRKIDHTIIAAALAPARIGADFGSEEVAFPDTQKVPVGYRGISATAANDNLNLAKLIAARDILGKNEAFGQDVDSGEQAHLFLSQSQLTALLQNVDQVSNADYASIKALESGEINHFMGFQIHRTELLPKDENGIRTCLVWIPSGMGAIVDKEPSSYVDILPGQSHTLQIRTTLSVGAVRLEDKKVVAIACDETPA